MLERRIISRRNRRVASARGGDSYEPAKALIKRWEGCRLTPYQDPIGLWTVGYGHLMAGKGKIKPEIREYSQAEVDALFDDDFNEHMAITLRVIANKARRRGITAPPMNHNQLGAVTSLVFNIGGGRFARSTICTLLADGNFDDAAEEFWKWRMAGGRVLNGLVKRRADEKQLFLSEV